MSSLKKYYKGLDLIRIFSCISVLLYHLNILKGGYLLVCSFFVLSGYLSWITNYNKKDFSFKEYYIKKLKHIYIPLLIVIFISIAVVPFLKEINWINMKPETLSVLFGYNNFWQLNANLDYFARHVNSPFIHFWYIAILLQLDLMFPFLFVFLKKMVKKFNKNSAIIIVGILTFISSLYFFKTSSNVMSSYYNTFARSFSWLFGLSLGLIHSYHEVLFTKFIENKKLNKVVFFIYIYIIYCLSVIVDAKSKYYFIAMVLTSIITCRLIDCSIINNKNKTANDNKLIKYFSSLSYEIYLVQYPIIFFMQYSGAKNVLIIPITIVLTIIISCFIHFCTNFKNKCSILQKVSILVLLCISCYGAYIFFTAKDYTKEMKNLENQLSKSQELMQQRQEKYLLDAKKEEEQWQLILKDFETGEAKLKDVVSNLSVVGIGDSVMLGAVENLYQIFPKGYFDAAVSRTAWVANDIIKNLKSKSMLGDAIVINLGANGDCSEECKAKIIKTCENKKIFWINTTNSKDVNSKLKKLSTKYNNLYIIDWYSFSKSHPEYFIADKIHLTSSGKSAYATYIYDSIYKVYLDEYNKEKQKAIDERENNLKNKVSFYGNDILLNAFKYIEDDFLDAKFNIDKNFTFEKLKNTLKQDIKNNTLNNKVVFAFDTTLKLTANQYLELVRLCSNRKIYLLSLNDEEMNFNNKNVRIMKFNYFDYLMSDRIHLTEEGNKALELVLKDIIN